MLRLADCSMSLLKRRHSQQEAGHLRLLTFAILKDACWNVL